MGIVCVTHGWPDGQTDIRTRTPIIMRKIYYNNKIEGFAGLQAQAHICSCVSIHCSVS